MYVLVFSQQELSQLLEITMFHYRVFSLLADREGGGVIVSERGIWDRRALQSFISQKQVQVTS